MDITRATELINQRLAEYPLDKKPSGLYRPMKYILNLDNRRFYPLLTLWGCYLLSGNNKKALTPSLGAELFYQFLLIHGDILDGIDQRNGKNSVHVKWNRNIAILSGDAMIFMSYEMLIQVDPPLIKPVVKYFNRCFTRICEGKQVTLNVSEARRQNNLQLGSSVRGQERLRPNSGVLDEFCLQLGAIIGGANQEQQDLITRLGSALATKQSLPDKSSSDLKIKEVLTALDCDEQRKFEFESWAKSL